MEIVDVSCFCQIKKKKETKKQQQKTQMLPQILMNKARSLKLSLVVTSVKLYMFTLSFVPLNSFQGSRKEEILRLNAHFPTDLNISLWCSCLASLDDDCWSWWSVKLKAMDGSWQMSFTLCIHTYVTSGGMHTEVGYLEASRSLKVEHYSKEHRQLLLLSIFYYSCVSEILSW